MRPGAEPERFWPMNRLELITTIEQTDVKLAAALAKLRECVDECSECDGTGTSTHLNAQGTAFDLHEDCIDCADIRAVIAECEQPKPYENPRREPC